MVRLERGAVVGGRYRLEQKLGEGGYGLVFSATDLGQGREVALKFLGRQAATRREGIARFEREARVFRELTHPNIVQTFGLGKTDDGVPFLVLELLRGETLGARIARTGALGTEATMHVGEQILRALWAAHERGIVHRDLKPDNIFLCQFPGAPDVARLLDFGVAHLRWDDGPTLTRASTVLGTPPYMAPEQVVGGAIDGRTDLYAMGLVLAECIEGKVVMDDPNPVKVALQHATPDPVVLGPRVLASPLRAAIQQAVEKDPARRPQSAREMLQLFPMRVTRPLSEVETAPTALAAIPDEISRDSFSIEPAPPPDPPEPPTVRGATPARGVIASGFGAPPHGISSSGFAAPASFEPPPATVRIASPPEARGRSGRIVAIVGAALIAAALVAAGAYFFFFAAKKEEAPPRRPRAAQCAFSQDIDEVVVAGTSFAQAEQALVRQKFVADKEPPVPFTKLASRSYFKKETGERIVILFYPPRDEAVREKLASNGTAATAGLDGCRVALTRSVDATKPGKQTAEATLRELFPGVGDVNTSEK